MRAGRILWRLAPFLAALIAGCAPQPHTLESSPPTSLPVSRDGMLHYQVPEGWFDATADSPLSGPVIWILRNDYGAAITVSEIHLDAQARHDLAQAGLVQLAHLTQTLGSGDRPSLLLHAPELLNAGGREMCAYEMTSAGAADTVRVLLFDTGSRVYSVSALQQAGGVQQSAEDLAEIEQEFVVNLRW